MAVVSPHFKSFLNRISGSLQLFNYLSYKTDGWKYITFHSNYLSVLIYSYLQTKYTILDERDIGLVHQYTFEPRLEVDRNGHGAKIYAVCYIYERGRETGVLVQVGFI